MGTVTLAPPAAPAPATLNALARGTDEAGRVIGLPKCSAEALLDWLEAHGRPGRLVPAGEDCFTVEWGPADE